MHINKFAIIILYNLNVYDIMMVQKGEDSFG